MISNNDSVIICGGGIVGLSCAYYLAIEGFHVTLIERNIEGADSCVHGSAGYISPSHVLPLAAPGMVLQGLKWMLNSRSPFYVRPRLNADLIRWSWLFGRACSPRHTECAAPVLRDLCIKSRELFVDLAVQSDDAFEFKTEGLLNLCKTQKGLDHEAHCLARLANELGVEAQVLSAKQTAALEPGIRLDVAGSVYFPLDAHLTPRKFEPVLRKLAQEAGVNFLWKTSVTGWRTIGGRIAAVQTTAGEIPGGEFILAGGAWSPLLVAELGLRLPMQAGKGYSLTIERPSFRLSKPIIFTERRIAVTPMGEQLRFGGTMELSGINDTIRPKRIHQIIESVPIYFPEFDKEEFTGIKPWIGLRPVSPDGLPYIGRFSQYRNLIAACGHAMLGLTMAPITGRLVAEILTGREPSVSLKLLNPDRYA